MRTVSMTVEFDVDVRGEFTEKKMLKLLRNSDGRVKNPNFVDVSIDGVPNEGMRKLFARELQNDLIG